MGHGTGTEARSHAGGVVTVESTIAPEAYTPGPSRPAPAPVPPSGPRRFGIERVSLRRTFQLIRSDYVRMARHYQFRLGPWKAVEMSTLPAIMGLVMYRFSHYFYARGWRFFAWPIYTLNMMMTGLDITPSTVIGDSCLLGHTVGTMLSGRIGRYATILAKVGVGGGRGPSPDGDPNGLPIVGDFVTLGVNSTILGPVRVGNHATVGAHSLVLDDVPESAVVTGIPARVTRMRAPGEGWFGDSVEFEGGSPS